jgi:thymidylate synthase (FAD)
MVKTVYPFPATVLNAGELALVDYMGTEATIVNSARISYASMSKTGRNPEADVKLLKYLWTNKHTTPFESCVLTFRIKAPIFVVRQWHRHRMFSYNEISARYTELPDVTFVPEIPTIGEQSIANKQQRTGTLVDTDLGKFYQEQIEAQNSSAFACYKMLLARGLPRELARTVLPLGTYTEFLATGNLHSWMHFLRLRLGLHSQYEIRVYAEAIQAIIGDLYPNLMEVFKNENQTEN